jgi:hypothetical protein
MSLRPWLYRHDSWLRDLEDLLVSLLRTGVGVSLSFACTGLVHRDVTTATRSFRGAKGVGRKRIG